MMSFDEIFRRYNREVLRYCLRHLSSVEDAEEIASDVFVNFWRHSPEIEDPDKVYSYLIISARNLIINAYRRRVDSETYAEYVRYVQSHAADERHGHSSIEYREFEDMVKGAIAKLPPTQRDVIMLSRFEGLDNVTIARRLNLSVQTVKNAISVGLKGLRAIMHGAVTSCILLSLAHAEAVIKGLSHLIGRDGI